MNQAALQFEDDGFPVGFWHWLRQNEHIYSAFKCLAFQMALSGRTRYSARTIVENIRWKTDLRDSDKTFKINNIYTPGMARLFMSEYGEKYPGFFQLRDSLGRDQVITKGESK